MAITREAIVAKAQSLFGQERSSEALAIVDQYGTLPHEGEVDRVKMAILEVSEGKLARLPYFVKCAKIDYRDVLIGAKLPPMTEAEEAEWQKKADRMLASWNTQSR